MATGRRFGDQRRLEARHEVERQERAVDRHGGDVAGLRRLAHRPGHAGVQAGERAGIALDAVGDDRQAIAGKARGVAVGVDDDAADLRAQPREDVRSIGLPPMSRSAFSRPPMREDRPPASSTPVTSPSISLVRMEAI